MIEKLKKLLRMRLYDKEAVKKLCERNADLRERARPNDDLQSKVSLYDMMQEQLESCLSDRREAMYDRFRSNAAMVSAARAFAERESALLARIERLQSIVDRLPKESRWKLSEKVTPSSKTLFECGSCCRLSVGPDKVCPSGCRSWDGMPTIAPEPFSGDGFRGDALPETLRTLEQHSVCAICGKTVRPHGYVHVVRDPKPRFASVHEPHGMEDSEVEGGWWPVDEDCAKLFPDSHICMTLPQAHSAPRPPTSLLPPEAR